MPKAGPRVPKRESRSPMNYAVSNTKEIALEQAIERRLCGASSEELAAGAAAEN